MQPSQCRPLCPGTDAVQPSGRSAPAARPRCRRAALPSPRPAPAAWLRPAPAAHGRSVWDPAALPSRAGPGRSALPGPAGPAAAAGGMTLKSGRSAGGGSSSMRTALSDLYLEHLLQNRPKPEVSGPLRPQTPRLRLRPSPGPIPIPIPAGPRRQPWRAPLSCGPSAQRCTPGSGPARVPLHPVPPAHAGQAGSQRQGPKGRVPALHIPVCALSVAWLVPSTPGAGMLAGEVGCLRGMVSLHSQQKELGAGEEGSSIPPRKRLCLFCCKVVSGLNWNCLSHELIQLLSYLQVHGMGWRSLGVSSPRDGGCKQPFSCLPRERERADGRMHPTSNRSRAGCTGPLDSAGGLLPQLVLFVVAGVQPGEGQQLPVLNSWCFSPSRDFQL